ncbi:hypothetical protein DL93DRAFT_1453708 [Clavulina sp. PMI_390]|nr:hypothetical protein DL93DRAFT_1453708 [Clavulina sp. PMI_390]
MQLSPPQQNPWHATPLAAGQCDDLALLRETTRRGEPSNTGSRIAYDLMMLYVWLFSGMVPIPPLIQSVSNAGLRIDRTPRVAVRPDPSIHSPPPTIFFPELPRPYESICCSGSLVCQPQAPSKGIASAITRAAQLAGEQIIRHSPLALGQRRTLRNVSKYDIDANASRALLTHVASFIMSSERGWNRPQVRLIFNPASLDC